MRHVRLIAVDDDYDTSPGLALKGCKTWQEGFMAARDGLIIAHDLLEHQNGAENIGAVWDELEALGALWFLRGRHGDLMTRERSIWTPVQNVAADVARMFTDGEWSMEPYMPAKGGVRAGDEDDSFHEIIAEARSMILREMDRETREAEDASLDRYLAEALQRLRIGYRKARRRFGLGWHDGPELFRAIRDAVNAAVKSVEWAGQEFVLHYGKGRAYVTEVHHADA